MNKITILGMIIPTLILLIGTPLHAFALSSEERYNVGLSDGQSEAQADWNNNNPYNDSCPPGHTDAYCQGYQNGYASYWGSAQQNVNGNVQQSNEQNANVKINGNNNRVNIEQQAGNNNGGSDGHHHNDGGSQNPECRVLCLGVNIR